MARNKEQNWNTSRLARLFASLLALCVWQLAAALVHNSLLLVGPVQVAGRLWALLLHPYLTAVKTVPVASFIVIALLWLSGRRLSIFISFLMVLPVLYSNFLQGIRGADGKLLEMARVFRMSFWNRLRGIYLPALEPHCLSGCRSALGLCWKAGVAAEVIGVCGGSVGGMLYDAKVYLEIGDLFAWTLVIVLLSVGFEWAFTRLLRRLLKALEGC